MEDMTSSSLRPAKLLTARALESLKPESNAYLIPDSKAPPLKIRVAPSGQLTWDLAFKVAKGGAFRRPSLGRWPDVSIEQARNRTHELTTAARLGKDLIGDEQKTKSDKASEMTVSTLIDRYCRQRAKGLRTAADIERRLKRGLGPILAQPVSEVRRRELRELLDGVEESGKRREAEKRRQTIGAMFRWAVSKDILEEDPTAGLSAYDYGTPRDRVLSAQEVRDLVTWLATSDLPPDQIDVLRLQLATGARCSEIGGMRQEEIDREKWLWTLPASRSKNKKPRVTPLVGWAREIVEARRGPGALFCAESGRPLNSAHVGQALNTRRKRCPVHFNTHDLRRTFVTHLAEMGIALDLIGALVGHESGGRQMATLLRHYVSSDFVERKRTALLAWDRRLREIVDGKNASNIIQIERRA